MKDSEIYKLLKNEINIPDTAVQDYRPMSEFYNNLGIPTIKDAITVHLKGNGVLLYLPEYDIDGNPIVRPVKSNK